MTWAFANALGGTAFSSDGTMGTIYVDDSTAVPATAIICNGFAHHQDGRRYIASWPASGTVFYTWDGIAVRSDGAMIVATAGTIAEDAHGTAVTYRGEVVVSTTAPTFFDDGVGLLQDGTLCVSDAAAWTPASLFASSEEGVLLECAIANLAQDSANTTPVAANADPVGYWADTSGNDKHFVQATAGARGTYSTTIPSVTFDGSADYLAYAGALTQVTGSVLLVIETGATAFAANQAIISSADTGSANNWFEIGIDASGRVYVDSNAAGTQHTVRGTTVLANSTQYLIAVVHDGVDYYVAIGSQEENPLIIESVGAFAWFGDVTGADNLVLGGTVTSAGLVRPFKGGVSFAAITAQDILV